MKGDEIQFPTLATLIEHYIDKPHSIQEKKGDYIQLLYPVRSTDPTTERWYHGRLSSKECERLLLSKGKQGSYLVRESQSQPGQFALAVRCNNGVQQVIINHKDDKFFIKSGAGFSSLPDLIDYFVSKPKLRNIKDQSPIKLREPFHSSSFIVSSIDERMKVLAKENKKGITGYREEFELLNRFDQSETAYTTQAGSMEENKWKNRYKNILPYDHSRVHLKGVNSKDPGRDYINANYINVDLKSWKGKYIAAQGCLPNTCADFWLMNHQHNVNVILMLTNLKEKGKNKCAKYWPDLGLSEEYGRIVVDNMLEHKSKHFTVRELRVYDQEKAKKAPQMVYQYHFTEWPDHGVPEDSGIILGLLSEIHLKHELVGKNSPIIVHCSAGIGRTGTVMAIDILMHLIDENGTDSEIDVLKTCQLLRAERSGIIQTEIQYRFLYEAMKHYLSTEEKREDAKKDQADGRKPSYGNIDFGKRDEPQKSELKSPPPEKPVPRPPNDRKHLATGVPPTREKAVRSRVQTNPERKTKQSVRFKE